MVDGKAGTVTRVLTGIEEIAGSIVDVIDGSTSELVLVSPYVQIQLSKSKRWKELDAAIRRAVTRGVTVTFISRTADGHSTSDVMKTLSPFREIGCSVFLVKDLHAKIYYNDRVALVTSLNLYLGSTLHNKEIGVLLSDPGELATIRSYICEMIGSWDKRSVGGGRAQSRNKAPSGLQDTWFKVIKAGRKYCHARLEGKYPVKIDIDPSGDRLVEGASYGCKATISWKTTKRGSRKCYVGNIESIKKKE